MPYIDNISRREINDGLPENLARTTGELNYIITSIVCRYLNDAASRTPGGTINYDMVNAVVGVLECAKLELYRRVAAPYESMKCRDNGDIPLYSDMSRAYYAHVASSAKDDGGAQ